MRWKRVCAETERPVRDFLIEREARCSAAASRFKELAACGFGSAAPGKAWAGFREDGHDAETARSLVVLMKSGVISVVLDDPADPANEKALKRLFRGKRASSVQGTTADVAVVERVKERGFNPFASPVIVDPVDYSLMNLDEPPRSQARSAGPKDLVIRRAFSADAELLFPLQAAYELEEVVPKGGEFNAAAARLAFEKSLRERLILYAILDGAAVGKAGTNASAYRRDQIGGVFVDPRYRGRGIATRLVAELSAALIAENRKVVLFVKKRNIPARAAYEKVGFALGPDYRITYYTEAKR